MITPHTKEESELIKNGYRFIAGIDEAGRGSWAGPVVAAAVVMPVSHFHPAGGISPFPSGVKDSKLLSPKMRDKLFDEITCSCIGFGVGIVENDTIDEINIYQAAKLAMKQSVEDMQKRSNYVIPTRNEEESQRDPSMESPMSPETTSGVLRTARSLKRSHRTSPIKGFRMAAEIMPDFLLIDAMSLDMEIPQKAIIKGDTNIYSIACASIIAKVTRDRLMIEFHEKYPEYSFDKHKGYGTKIHLSCLEKHGPCKIHRKTYSPIAKLIKQGL